MNNLALQELTDRKLSSVCLSPELSLDEVMAIKSALPLEVIVHGSVPLMTSEHCVVGAVVGEKQGKHCKMPCLEGEYKLNDRKDYDFPLVLQQDCSMQILNARELCILEEVRALLAGPISRVRLLLRERQDDEIKVICRNYRKIMDNKKLDASEIKKELEKVSPYGLTKGHYFREVE
jgi:putative protease